MEYNLRDIIDDFSNCGILKDNFVRMISGFPSGSSYQELKFLEAKEVSFRWTKYKCNYSLEIQWLLWKINKNNYKILSFSHRKDSTVKAWDIRFFLSSEVKSKKNFLQLLTERCPIVEKMPFKPGRKEEQFEKIRQLILWDLRSFIIK